MCVDPVPYPFAKKHFDGELVAFSFGALKFSPRISVVVQAFNFLPLIKAKHPPIFKVVQPPH